MNKFHLSLMNNSNFMNTSCWVGRCLETNLQNLDMLHVALWI